MIALGTVVSVAGGVVRMLDLTRAVVDLSPSSHVPRAPPEPLSLGPVAALAALAVVLGAAGLVGFRRRDIG